MKKASCRMVLALSVAAFTLCPAAFAQPGGEQAKANSDPLALYKNAGIDSEQEGEIRKLMKEFESAHRVRLKSLFGMIKQMRNLQLQPNPNEEQVLELQEEINKASGVIATERIKLMLKIRKLLSPMQRQRLVKLVRVKAGVENNPQAK